MVVATTQVVVVALTARMIDPAQFGAYACAQAGLALASYFSLRTVGSAIVREPALTAAKVGTGLWMSLASGVSVAFAMVVLAPTWAAVWRSPDAVPLMRLLALVAVLSSAVAVPLGLVQRRLRYRAASLSEAAGQVFGLGSSLLLAVATHNVASLAIGQVLGMGMLLALSAGLSRKELSFRFQRPAVPALLGFSSQISLQNLGYYALYTAPAWTIGRASGDHALGLFSRVQLLVVFPLQYMTAGVSKALYPVYPRLLDSPREVEVLLRRTLGATVAVGWPLFAWVAGASQLLVPLLFGSRWEDASAFLPPLALFGAWNLCFVILGSANEAHRYLRDVWCAQLVFGALIAVSTGAALTGLSTVQFLWMMATTQIVAHSYQLHLASGRGLIDLAAVFRAYLATFPVAALWGSGSYLSVTMATTWPLWLALAFHIAVALALGVALELLGRRFHLLRSAAPSHALLTLRGAAVDDL